mmetsp:Transcript_6434/g.22132  ORF Transcript_6434/g.22132 Transcript_6434/m.22132 type:complete len:253 (-) Transcript_6434:245-1003(-)
MGGGGRLRAAGEEGRQPGGEEVPDAVPGRGTLLLPRRAGRDRVEAAVEPGDAIAPHDPGCPRHVRPLVEEFFTGCGPDSSQHLFRSGDSHRHTLDIPGGGRGTVPSQHLVCSWDANLHAIPAPLWGCGSHLHALDAPRWSGRPDVQPYYLIQERFAVVVTRRGLVLDPTHNRGHPRRRRVRQAVSPGMRGGRAQRFRRHRGAHGRRQYSLKRVAKVFAARRSRRRGALLRLLNKGVDDQGRAAHLRRLRCRG